MRSWRQFWVFALVCGWASGHGILSDALAQNRFTPPRRPASSAPQARQRATTPRRPAANSRQQATARRSGDVAARTKEPTPPSPETRAVFQQLIRANWIWSPAHTQNEVPVGDCYFRKTLHLGLVEFGEIQVACDNQYELYVNGQLVGQGRDWRHMDVHDVAKYLHAGKNVVAIKASNTDAGASGLVARVLIKQQGGSYESHSTDESWRTSEKLADGWQLVAFPDGAWLPAKDYGLLGTVLPWGNEVVIAGEGAQFTVEADFQVERLIEDQQAGSLIAMTFTSDGSILASQEGGPLLRIRDADADGRHETVETFCDKVKNVQGILSLGGRVFVVGEGPDGPALYRLMDHDHDGRPEDVKTMVVFKGGGEHGPHAVQLGPEGLLYVMVGNFSHVAQKPRDTSPYAKFYEGDLVQPRYEDPRGYAVGVKAPGGTVIRTDFEGTFVETFAGGLRNCYDFAFNEDGELLTYDADMEWDVGAPWYRPTRVIHVPPSAELGWRSGWAKWPDYYLDSLPGTLDMGPGSPTGAEFYQHVAYPRRFHGGLFVCDWALGEIRAVQLERSGATYRAKSSVFLRGRPLNVTDVAVGPDGMLYFSTGGRGTEGGIYRVAWKGDVPPELTSQNHGIEAALRQPQVDADWSRARLAGIKRELGPLWGSELQRIMHDVRQPIRYRLRAVYLLTFFGPPPSSNDLLQLSRDPNAELRAKAVRLMSVRGYPGFSNRLVELLGDDDALVRRLTLEAIARRDQMTPIDPIVKLLADRDRFVAFAARRCLEETAVDRWKEPVLESPNQRVFLEGAVALLTVEPTRENALAIVERSLGELQNGSAARSSINPLRNGDQLDQLRVIQLALSRGMIEPKAVPELSKVLIAKYPTVDSRANRELVKLLAYLEPAEAPAKFVTELAREDLPAIEKLQIAAYAPRIKEGWGTPEKIAMLRYYEQNRELEGGHSLSAYVENFARDFFTNLSLDERRQILALGERFPTSIVSILAKLPAEPGPELLAEIRALDARLRDKRGDVYDRARVGIVAALGATKEAESHAYLREIFHSQPERRAPVAMSLTQNPEGDNWDILVESLGTIDAMPARAVMTALAKIDRHPDKPEPYREVILQALRLRDNGSEAAIRLLEHWSDDAPTAGIVSFDATISSWQDWYATRFPEAPPAVLPKESEQDKWTYEELLSFLESDAGRSGDAYKGAIIYREALCASCHRFNDYGEGMGPDLTTVSRRFHRREILESILFPSHNISDQYASTVVVANGGLYVGIASEEKDEVVVQTAEGHKVRLDREDVDEMRKSTTSAMPAGLLNSHSLKDIADLFAYLMESGPTHTASGKAGPVLQPSR